MENKEQTRIIHVQVIDGSTADIYDIGKAMKEFTKKLPFKLEAIVTSEKVVLRDVMTLIKELWALKKELEKKVEQ